LSAYQDGALSEPERTVIRGHLAQCAECGALATEFDNAWGLLDLVEAANIPPMFVAGVMCRVQGRLSRPVWQAPRWAVATGLAFCLACGAMAGYLHSGGAGSATVSQATLAADMSRQVGGEASAPAPAETLAGAYVQLTGSDRER
jgi:anti-sigma factor RsiW